MNKLRFSVLLFGLVFASVQISQAAIRSGSGFDTNTLAPNDDASNGPIALPFTINFFGVDFSQAWVNNNGNITFDGALSEYTPFDLTSTGQQIIAPFFADVDTRNAGDPVKYGVDSVDGRNAFGVNWINVDYFASSPNHSNRNRFQLVLIDRSDTGVGNFDIEFNYEQIQWETGEASGGDADGLGGDSARAGFSNGTGDPGTFFELTGSAVNGAFLDGGPNALAENSMNSIVEGRYLFEARNGTIPPRPGQIPEPASIAIWCLLAMVGLTAVQRRKR